MTEEEEFWDYDKVIELYPNLKGIIDADSWNHIAFSNKNTGDHFEELWRKNTRINIEKGMWRRHGSLRKDCIGIGNNKAVIGVGAGKSFDKNKEFLKQLADVDGRKDWEQRDFIIVASNHQFKPLIKMGIIPDFVMLADASDDVIPQLTEDIPPVGECATPLITTIAASPKLLKIWTRQRRDIRFFIPTSPMVMDEFKKVSGKDPEPYTTLIGGNVLNCLFLLSLGAFRSSTFFAVGNDLSYVIEKDLEKRRSMYYADGDYTTTQMQDGRDEAKNMWMWMGFTLERPKIFMGSNGYRFSLAPVGTTHNLWIYKTWMEAWLLANMDRNDLRWHYYNCSEGGILGVMCKTLGHEAKKDEDWYLLDSVCKRYHTMMLEDAANMFMMAKEAMKWPGGVIEQGVPNVIDLARQNMAGIAGNTHPNGKIIGI